jgi:integrase
MAPRAKKHLPFSDWPTEDRVVWARVFEPSLLDDERRTAHLAAATVVGLRTSYARYLGFLARHDPEQLEYSAPDRVGLVSVKAFVAHLRESCSDTSVASLLHTLRLTLGFLWPERDWSWLKTIAKRINAAAQPRTPLTKGLTSAELYAVGIDLMSVAEADFASSRKSTMETALCYRDGLIIALLAAVPLRRRTLAALTVDRHLVKIGPLWLLDIPSSDTKARRALEFPLPDVLAERVSRYLDFVRPIIPGARNHNGVWASVRGRPMDGGSIYNAVCQRTREALGFPVNLHRFRAAAGNFWSIADSINVRGVKDLLGHSSFGTTEKHYIDARSRVAGRALAKALRP